MSLLQINDLELNFGSGPGAVRGLDKVSLTLEAGKVLCLVGESGSGKSITALSIAKLLPTPPVQYVGGEILVEGQDVLKMAKRDLRRIRGGVVSYIFQEPSASLNPVFRVGSQILETLKLHHPAAANEAEVVRLLKLVGIPSPELRARSYPHEMSGGMQQRVMIAMAIASRPKLLVADEPTTALDVTIQAQIIDLLRQLKDDFGMSILLITHNLGLVSDIGDSVAVMYGGQIVEQAAGRELLDKPLHPYTKALLKSVPSLGSESERLLTIQGQPPSLGAWPTGCHFHPRCSEARLDCSKSDPELKNVSGHRQVRCPWVED